MRKPSHLVELESAGKSFGDLCRFRGLLEQYGITVAWNIRQRCWILGQVPKDGPTFVSLKVGTLALVDLMSNPQQVAIAFDRTCAAASACWESKSAPQADPYFARRYIGLEA
jgi:hypothetical protein